MKTKTPKVNNKNITDHDSEMFAEINNIVQKYGFRRGHLISCLATDDTTVSHSVMGLNPFQVLQMNKNMCTHYMKKAGIL